MEFSIKMLAVVILVLVVVFVAIILIATWSGQTNTAVGGMFDFFNKLLSGKQVSTTPSMPLTG